MANSNELIIQSQNIMQQVLAAQKANKPIDGLVKQQIKVMEEHHDEFVKEAVELGIDNLERAKIEIKLYANIKAWAKKIGLPTEKYDNAILEIQKRFGAD
jgi:ferritin-like metal-binding protein YciE